MALFLSMLPPELRKAIYSMVFESQADKPFDPLSRKEKHRLNLLHVSRQVRKEASGLFYSSTPFTAVITDITAKAYIVYFMRCISRDHARYIPSFTLLYKLNSKAQATLEEFYSNCHWFILGGNAQQARHLRDAMHDTRDRAVTPIKEMIARRVIVRASSAGLRPGIL